jgi:uncharacterized protein YkwD
MKKIIITVILVLVLGLTGLMVSEYRQESTPVFSGASDFTSAVNTERAGRDLEPLMASVELNKVAESKCNDMVQRNYTAHQDPEGDYIWKDLEPNHRYGENIGIGFYSSYETMQAWKNSKTHYDNIIDPQYREVGHFTCYTGDKYLTVQVFKSN